MIKKKIALCNNCCTDQPCPPGPTGPPGARGATGSTGATGPLPINTSFAQTNSTANTATIISLPIPDDGVITITGTINSAALNSSGDSIAAIGGAFLATGADINGSKVILGAPFVQHTTSSPTGVNATFNAFVNSGNLQIIVTGDNTLASSVTYYWRAQYSSNDQIMP